MRHAHIPSETRIFHPPPRIAREPGRAYGKLALLPSWKIQHQCLLDNYRMARSWVHDGMVNGSLPSIPLTLEREEDRRALHAVIEENKDHLQALKFWGKEPYEWKHKSVYQKLRKHLKYKRQKARRLERRRKEVDATATCLDAGEVPETSLAGERRLQSLTVEELQRHCIPTPASEEDLAVEDFCVKEDEKFLCRVWEVHVGEMYGRLGQFMQERNGLVKSSRRKPFCDTGEGIDDHDKMLRFQLRAVAEHIRRTMP
jgi:hypothetical protein